MSTMNQLLVKGQKPVLAPEDFQAALIDGMTGALLRPSQPPCLLRAPTGSGKTLMMARVLANVSAEVPVVWFWFVPFVNLVSQTQDALAANASDLSPILLKDGRNQDATPGQVLLSTVQGVARAQWRKQGYNADGDDDTRTLAEHVARVRAAGYQVGLVVDEAHIALKKTTEFGRFAQWLAADYLVMATATPKDQRLLDFLASAGKSEFESFSISRDDVVEARLNKKYIEAVVYDLRQSTQNITDLQRTVLRQAWLRNQWLKKALAQSGVPLVPLLLVQVADGPTTVEDAEHQLITLCKVPPAAIGKHSADAPDPSLMEAIANDRTKEVLIFKQSAGTGFDAPRAFVLASTKSVSDPDFAMQFIGRVMRVSHPMRAAYPRPKVIPAEFDTAYVYLANAEAQRGFEQAVYTTTQVMTQLEGQTEKMIMRRTASGAVGITNKPVSQFPLSYEMGPTHRPYHVDSEESTGVSTPSPSVDQVDFFADETDQEATLDLLAPEPATGRPEAAPKAPENVDEVLKALQEKGIRAYPLSETLPRVPNALKREHRPQMLEMSELSRKLAKELQLPTHLVDDSIKAACNQLKEIERHTELTTHRSYDTDVLIVTDRRALAKEATAALRSLPQVEDEGLHQIEWVD
ncbi:DEAD/DEAH box helicase [Haliea sp.]|uniref:DEAD/DEAH box helicase n=1 Tax=Haliea sp. TaxID=1932666 RepID=UPI000C614CCC|nr:DEAD/DEAH box helicase family protein [Haliea sp.]MAD65597.1 restriction endonuclease subunit R [Haliea sp.]|tara:strand:+ start:5100 stop:7004 length:1905 start_codon:yes stop_codon:yes gene_type:complete